MTMKKRKKKSQRSVMRDAREGRRNIADVRPFLFLYSWSSHVAIGSDDEDGLEEDDLDLLEENTGASFKKSRLTRLKRRRDSPSPSSSSRRKNVVESSDDDFDDEQLPKVQDIQSIWEDAGRDDDDDADGDIDDFIEYDEEEGLDERDREAQRKERRKQQAEMRRKARGALPEMAGIDAK
jgi:transcription elongation factor SPT6